MKEKTLIIYYSQARGNTKRIAEKIHRVTGFDMVRLDTVQPYTGSYQEIVDQGKQEVNKGFLPQIKSLGVDISAYNRLIVGTPTWWYTMAPAVRTFLASNDFTGKTIVPFMTHGGWPGHVMKDIKDICKRAVIEKEFSIQFDSTGGDTLVTDENEIDVWIKSL